MSSQKRQKNCLKCDKNLIGHQTKFCSVKCKVNFYGHNCYKSQKSRGLSRKLKLIESSGGCCSKCGYNKNYAALEFHHRDPKTKDFQLDARSISNRAFKISLAEAAKCDLICANCHRELHHPTCEL